MVAVDMATPSQLKSHEARKARLARLSNHPRGSIVPEARIISRPVMVASPPVQPAVQFGLLPDPRFTFANYKVGGQNQVAYAAAMQVADMPADAPLQFNPLLIHSRSGLGKTHLLHAIAHRHGTRALLLSAERFFALAKDSYGQAMLLGTSNSVDLVLMDDVHLLSSRPIQAQLGHLIQNLHDRRKQVVVTSNGGARELDTFECRLRERLSGGLEVAIGPQDYALRLQIIRARVGALRETHPDFTLDDAIVEYIANSLHAGGREIDGVMNRLVAQHTFARQTITMEIAEKVVSELRQPAEQKRIMIEDIQRVVARLYNVSLADLLSSRRTANVVRPRQVAMYLCKVLTLRSLPEIGRRFGGRDHTTVLHAVRKMDGLVQKDQVLRDEVECLKRDLNEA